MHFIFAFALAALLAVGPSAFSQPKNISQGIGFLHKEVCVTPTVTAANAYGINFVVGGLLTFSNALGAGGSGEVRGIVVTIKKVEASGFTFTMFNANPSNSTWTDAAVANINVADVPSLRNFYSLSDVSSFMGTATTLSPGVNMARPNVIVPGGSTLWGVLTTNAVLTNNFGSASDVQVCLQTYVD